MDLDTLKNALRFAQGKFALFVVFADSIAGADLRNQLDRQFIKLGQAGDTSEQIIDQVMSLQKGSAQTCVWLDMTVFTSAERGFIYARLNERRSIIEGKGCNFFIHSPPEDADEKHTAAYGMPDLWHVRACPSIVWQLPTKASVLEPGPAP